MTSACGPRAYSLAIPHTLTQLALTSHNSRRNRHYLTLALTRSASHHHIMAGISPYIIPSAPSSSSSRPRQHRKRVSFSRLSSDTTASLPPYRSALPAIEPLEQPPDYPDSAEEADEESEDWQPSHLISPPSSPRQRRRKFSKTGPHLRSGSIYAGSATQSDIFLDVSDSIDTMMRPCFL